MYQLSMKSQTQRTKKKWQKKNMKKLKMEIAKLLLLICHLTDYSRKPQPLDCYAECFVFLFELLICTFHKLCNSLVQHYCMLDIHETSVMCSITVCNCHSCCVPFCCLCDIENVLFANRMRMRHTQRIVKWLWKARFCVSAPKIPT